MLLASSAANLITTNSIANNIYSRIIYILIYIKFCAQFLGNILALLVHKYITFPQTESVLSSKLGQYLYVQNY